MDDAGPCRLLDWDTEFFGRRIATITAHRLSLERVEDAMAWCKRSGIQCLYFLADADDAETVRLAEEYGFRHVDVRITLERLLDLPVAQDRSHEAVVRLAVPADVPTLRALARVSHHDSRFYHDPNFRTSQCDALFETWIDKSCNGYADAVFVADLSGLAVGYVSCHRADRNEGKIGLFAVSAAHRGKGAGRTLLSESLRWFGAQGLRRVTVVTQGRNARAQRLYQQGGFVTHAVQLWYHRSFE